MADMIEAKTNEKVATLADKFVGTMVGVGDILQYNDDEYRVKDKIFSLKINDAPHSRSIPECITLLVERL